MESKKELYHQGLNPNFVESFNDGTCVQMLFALESLQIPYTRVPIQDHEVRSLRFYLPDEASVAAVTKFLQNGSKVPASGSPIEKYALVYENSFV